jgi:hypothetical protein
VQIRKNHIIVQGVLCLTLAYAFCVPAKATNVASFDAISATEIQERSKPQPPVDQPSADQSLLKPVVLTGTVVKNKSDYFLRDTGGTLYQLDAPEKAQPFKGKTVKVSGKLEANTSLVHIDSIVTL